MNSAMHMAQLLEQETTAVAQLMDILERERHALQRREVDTLSQCIVEKAPVIAQLQGLSQQRDTAVKSAGFTLNTAGLVRYLRQLDPQGVMHLIKHGHHLTRLAAQCHKCNAINGSIIAATRTRTERTLAILRGQHEQLTTYDPHGDHQGADQRLSLGVA